MGLGKYKMSRRALPQEFVFDVASIVEARSGVSPIAGIPLGTVLSCVGKSKCIDLTSTVWRRARTASKNGDEHMGSDSLLS